MPISAVSLSAFREEMEKIAFAEKTAGGFVEAGKKFVGRIFRRGSAAAAAPVAKAAPVAAKAAEKGVEEATKETSKGGVLPWAVGGVAAGGAGALGLRHLAEKRRQQSSQPQGGA